MSKSLYLEEMDGVRSLIATDGLAHWWVVPFEDGAEYYGIDLYDGTIDEVAQKVVGRVDVGEAIDDILDDEDYFNPAWDRFVSLSEAERHELSVVDEDVPCRYVEIK